MRILIASDLHWPNVNGVATFGRNLAHGLTEAGHEVLVIAPSQTGKKYEEIDGNYRIVRTSSVIFPFYQNYRISVSPYREVKRIVEHFQPDVIHTQSPLGIGRAAAGCAKKMHIPWVATNHAMPENLIDNLRLLAPLARPINYMLMEIGARFYNNADYVTLPTEAAADMLKKGDSFHAPYVAISNGIDLSRFSPGKVPKEFYERFGIPADKRVVLYVGRLDAEKHISVAVDAFSELSGDRPDLHLVIVGKGTDADNLKDQVNELGLQSKVTFTGFVEDEDLPNFHRLGKVFTIPSPVELQCLAMLESMASGSPVTAVNVGALYELCQDGKNGYLFDLDDSHQLAEKLAKILDDEKLYKLMSKESLAIARKHDLSNTIKEFVELYKHVMAMYEAQEARTRTENE